MSKIRTILILPRYERMGASSRLRSYQYVEGLEKSGWKVEILPLLRAAYLEQLYSGQKPSRRAIVADYFSRILKLLSASQYDLIWIEKELFPFLPNVAEQLIRISGVPYIVDYDDAIFHTYDQHRLPFVRHVLGKKLDGLLRSSAAVTVGNPYLASYCRGHGAPDAHIVPTVIDISRYCTSPVPGDKTLRLGWIGSPATTPLLQKILPQIAIAAQTIPLVLVTIGASALEQSGLEIEQHQWTEADETRLLQTIDVGIMPLSDTPFERGKCGYKLIQYMGVGRPVIASDVGVNRDIVTQETGFLVQKDASWAEAIIEAASSRERLQKMGIAARNRAETIYSIDTVLPRLVSIFDNAIIKHKSLTE